MADLRTPAERAYDATSLFLSPDPWVPILAITDDPTNDGRDIPITIDQQPADRQPFGTLADGTVMCGTFYTTAAGANQRSGCVNIRTSTIMLTADCDGFVSGGNRRGGEEPTIDFNGASLDDIRALRTFLNSDAIERMLAAAVAWENGDTEPPTT